jgi:plastocyanin
VIRIGTLPGLRFDVSEFSVKPGAEVEVVFTNTDEMLHNFVVTKPGARLAVVQAAIELGAGAAERDFVPDSPDVLWATKVVASGQSASVTFTAPSAVGEYPYVCTFPGHGFMMFGTMVVTETPRAPVPTEAVGAMADAADHHAMGHANANAAKVSRFFMPEAGPTSIAVQLPGGVLYCWDAGAGRFRYAWKGGYIEKPDRGTAKVLGEIFYREEAFPLRVGVERDAGPRQIDFKGYTLDAQGIPEFETVVDGVTVRERIEFREGELVRRFRTDAGMIWFAMPTEDPQRIEASGVREGAFYRFTGAAAREFTITYRLPAN